MSGNELAVLEALGTSFGGGSGYALLRLRTRLPDYEIDRSLVALEEAELIEIRRGELLGMPMVSAELTTAGWEAAGADPAESTPADGSPVVMDPVAVRRKIAEGESEHRGRPPWGPKR